MKDSISSKDKKGKKVKLFLTEESKKTQNELYTSSCFYNNCPTRDEEIPELICSHNNLWGMC